MEIKTTKEISESCISMVMRSENGNEPYAHIKYERQPQKQWVSVESLNYWLKNLYINNGKVQDMLIKNQIDRFDDVQNR